MFICKCSNKRSALAFLPHIPYMDILPHFLNEKTLSYCMYTCANTSMFIHQSCMHAIIGIQMASGVDKENAKLNGSDTIFTKLGQNFHRNITLVKIDNQQNSFDTLELFLLFRPNKWWKKPCPLCMLNSSCPVFMR